MKKRSAQRRSASRAKLLVAAICLGLGWGAASVVPNDSTLGETWSVRFESFDLFSLNAFRRADERPLCYLDANGRRFAPETATTPTLETEPAFLAESEELLADDVATETQALGATFAETVSPVELAPVSFADETEETLAPVDADAENGWLVVDENAEKRDRWSREIALEPFAAPNFAESSLPTWRDEIAVVPATTDELRALEFEPGLSRSALVSSTLRRRAALAPLASGAHSFAETANVSDANASANASQPEAPRVATTAPARVGSFSAPGMFDANGVATVRVQ